MKGLFPFLQEFFFGPKKLTCTSYDSCEGLRAPYCYGGHCARHCLTWCQCLENQDKATRAINQRENVEVLDQKYGNF